jgi:hypothetical protein
MAATHRASRVPAETAGELAIRDQEVVRATRELAAYFKGQRTEREARAALKIIKAFVRDRERGDSGSRRPLPGLGAAAPSAGSRRKAAPARPRKAHRRRAPRPAAAGSVVAPNEPSSGEPGDE